MKITNDHYNTLKELVMQVVKENPDMPLNDGSMRYRWMIYNLICDYDGYDLAHHLYDYLNDDHIDTALKKILKELSLWKSENLIKLSENVAQIIN